MIIVRPSIWTVLRLYLAMLLSPVVEPLRSRRQLRAQLELARETALRVIKERDAALAELAECERNLAVAYEQSAWVAEQIEAENARRMSDAAQTRSVG